MKYHQSRFRHAYQLAVTGFFHLMLINHNSKTNTPVSHSVPSKIWSNNMRENLLNIETIVFDFVINLKKKEER